MLVLQPGCYLNMFITLLWSTGTRKIAPFSDDSGIRISESGFTAHWEFTNPDFSLRIVSLNPFFTPPPVCLRCLIKIFCHTALPPLSPPPEHTQLSSVCPHQLHELNYGAKEVIKWDKDRANRWSRRYDAALNCLQSSAHVSR